MSDYRPPQAIRFLDRHPWLAAPLLLLAFVVPSCIDAAVQMVLR